MKFSCDQKSATVSRTKLSEEGLILSLPMPSEFAIKNFIVYWFLEMDVGINTALIVLNFQNCT